MINEHLPQQLKESRLKLLKVPPQLPIQLDNDDEEESSLEIFIDNSVSMPFASDVVETMLSSDKRSDSDISQDKDKVYLKSDSSTESEINIDKEIVEIETKLNDVSRRHINQEYMPFLEEYQQVGGKNNFCASLNSTLA